MGDHYYHNEWGVVVAAVEEVLFAEVASCLGLYMFVVAAVYTAAVVVIGGDPLGNAVVVLLLLFGTFDYHLPCLSLVLHIVVDDLLCHHHIVVVAVDTSLASSAS